MAITDDLFAFWELEEASGTRSDSHGTNHLADNNTVTQAAGKVGNAAEFTAANSEYLSIADNAALSAGDIDFTLCAWVYLDSVSDFHFAGKWNTGAASREYSLRCQDLLDANGVRFGFIVSADGTNGTATHARDLTTTVSSGQWYFLVGWHDASANKVYLQVNNGTPLEAAHSTGAFDGTAAFTLSSFAGSSFFHNGRTDQAGFWKRVLTTDERTWLYNSGNGRSYAEILTESCSYAITPTSASQPAAGASGQTVAVTTESFCPWTATSNAAWLTITGGASGTGNGTVTYTIAANTGGARSGTLTIAGETFTVNQAVAVVPVANVTVDVRVLLDSWSFDPDVFDATVFSCGDEITDDLIQAEGVFMRVGIRDNGPRDAVASPGELRFSLRNDAHNGALEGRYSPKHANVHPLWRRGDSWVTLVLTHDGTARRRFTGRVAVIDPEPGHKLSRRVHVTAYDVMQSLAEEVIRAIDVQVNQTEVTILGAMLDALPVSARPLARDFDDSTDSYPYVLDDLGEQGVSALALIHDLAISGVMLVYADGDGTLVTQNRNTRALQESQATFTDTELVGISVPSTNKNVFSTVRTAIEPRTVDATATHALFTQQSVLELSPGETLVVQDTYRDPDDQQVSIAGVDRQPIEAGTDYAANTLSDGSGYDLTSFLEISVESFATFATTTLTNPTGARMFVTARQLRGKRVRRLAQQTFEAPSASTVGRTIEILLPYQDSGATASATATYVQSAYDSDNQVDSVSFVANRTSVLMDHALDRQIGERITVSETMTGLSALDVVIHSIEYEIADQRLMRCTFGVAPASPVDFWVWDRTGRNEWDSTAIWGF